VHSEKSPAREVDKQTNPLGQIVQVAVPVPAKRGQILTYDYYAGRFAPLARGMIVKIPLGRRDVWGLVLGHSQTSQISKERLKAVSDIADIPELDPVCIRFLEQLSFWTLASFGAVMRLMLNTPDAWQPQPKSTVYGITDTVPDDARLTAQRQRVLNFLQESPMLLATDIARETGVSTSLVKSMATAGLLRTEKRARQIDGWSDETSQPHTELMAQRRHQLSLSDAQAEIAGEMRKNSQDGFQVHLLDGVTGSGKTEIYFDLVAGTLASGKQVLILLPEIALTKAWQDRFVKWFGFVPPLWHSAVTSARRRILWRQAARGTAMVIAGARSALFLPFSNLGLIVVDEEHDASYKQEDQVAYHARDMALLRAKITNIPVILASATPSLESWINAGGGSEIAPRHPDWHHHVLTQRFGGAKLPAMNLIDMRLSRPISGQWLSAELKDRLARNFQAGEQSLLFLNRRGYAPMTICASCGYRLACHQCDSLLVTHKLARRVQCHFCGTSQPLSLQCPECGDNESLMAIGPGVERLQEEVQHLFPEARITVLSSDTVRTGKEAQMLFDQIHDRQTDIIIGTQMAAKGHHFPFLTLVGVVDADLGLGGGDLRAAERTYQMLWQVAGRSGRGDLPGQAYIQTYQPSHPVLQALCDDSSDPIAARNRFMAAEAIARKTALMPPFGRLAALILSSPDLTAIQKAAATLARNKPHFAQVDIFGPAEAPLSRIRGAFRIRFLIRTDRQVAIQKIIADWLNNTPIPPKTRISCDIDPYSFL